MTTNAPTAEDFLDQRDPEDEEHTEDVAVADDQEPEPVTFAEDPLESIASSLRQLTGAVLGQLGQAEHDELLEQHVAELETKLETAHGLLDEVRALCKKSTSKLAISIRAALESDTVTLPPEPEPVQEPHPTPAV